MCVILGQRDWPGNRTQKHEVSGSGLPSSPGSQFGIQRQATHTYQNMHTPCQWHLCDTCVFFLHLHLPLSGMEMKFPSLIVFFFAQRKIHRRPSCRPVFKVCFFFRATVQQPHITNNLKSLRQNSIFSPLFATFCFSFPLKPTHCWTCHVSGAGPKWGGLRRRLGFVTVCPLCDITKCRCFSTHCQKCEASGRNEGRTFLISWEFVNRLETHINARKSLMKQIWSSASTVVLTRSGLSNEILRHRVSYLPSHAKCMLLAVKTKQDRQHSASQSWDRMQSCLWTPRVRRVADLGIGKIVDKLRQRFVCAECAKFSSSKDEEEVIVVYRGSRLA